MKFQARNNHIINWPEYPILRITFCFIAGIFLSDTIFISMGASLFLSLGLVITYILLNRIFGSSKMIIRALSTLVILIGISLGVFRGNLQKGSNHTFNFLKFTEQENYVEGKIIADLKQKKRVSTTLQISQINGKKGVGKLLVYFSKRDSQINYQVGDVISIEGNIQLLNDNANPRSFNYKEYLKYKGIDAQIFLKDGQHRLIRTGELNILYETAVGIRKWALSIFEHRLKDKDQLATACAMVLGYKNHLSDELYTSFSETGAVHVLAVSGLHVGIICMIFIFLFNRIKNESVVFKLLKLITLLSVVWIYALVTGASPAVLRAAVMFSFILIGRLWFKGANIYNILAFSALIILTYDPYLLFQLSFQFSYLALISIVFFQPYIERWYETKHWVTTKICQLTSVSIAAQILIFPISIFYFHQFPTYFILSGVAAVFLATFILGLGLLLLALSGVPTIGDIISVAYSKLLEVFIKIISSIQSLPFNNVDGIYVSKLSVIILYVFIGISMLLISWKPKTYKDVFQQKLTRKHVAKLILGACIILLFSNNLFFEYRVKNQLELIVYDISQNTAIDIFWMNNLYSIQSKNIDKAKVDFASKSFRIFNGNPEGSVLESFCSQKYGPIFLNQNGSLILKGTHMILVDRVDLEKALPCASDILLVVNKTDVLPYKILENHMTKLVVLDNSLTYKIKNQWTKECQKRGIPVHDIRKDGVFRV